MRYAVIPAAGVGRRFGGKKQFFEINGTPVIEYTLTVFEKSELVHGIVVVLPEKDLGFGEKLKEKFRKIKYVVPGGAERQSSVYRGLKAIEGENVSEVLIHDGVRPFVSQSLIRELVVALSDYEVDGVIPGLKPRDTVKEVGAPLERGDFFVEKTVDRDKLVLAQTPQAFIYDVVWECHKRAREEEFWTTDDAALLEKYGYNVVVIPGDSLNVKITTKEDIKLAEFLLSYSARSL